MYVTDSNNGRLLVFDANDQVVAQVGRGVGEGNLGLPRGVAIDDKGRVYVADATRPGRVRLRHATSRASAASTSSASSGARASANGTFQFPNGIAVDARGRVYVTDSGNDRVQVWSY